MQKNLVFLENLVSKAGSLNFNPNLPKLDRQIFEMESCLYKTIAKSITVKEKKKHLSCFLEIFLLLMERLYNTLSDASENKAELTNQILSRLGDFIDFLEANTGIWFNYNLKTPTFMVGVLNKKLRAKEAELCPLLFGMNISRDLINVALNPLKRNYGLTRRIKLYRYFYLSRYCCWLSDFTQTKVHIFDHETRLLYLLITKNLNTPLFHSFLIKHLEEKFKMGKNPEQKLDILRNLQIYLTGFAPSTNLGYSLKKQTTLKFFQKTLSARICYYEKITSENTLFCLNEPGNPNDSRKIQTSLKVSHLGILCRLLYDQGQIINSPGTEVTRAFTKIFELKNKEPISGASLRNKFYSLDEKSLKEFNAIIKSWEERIKDLLYDLNYK